MNHYAQSSRFQTPPVVLNLIIINALFYMAMSIVPGGYDWLLRNLGLYFWESPLFRPWQLVTHMFLHGSLTHLFFNMFALWMFGRILEMNFGARRFLLYYFVTGVGAAVLQLLVNWIEISHLHALIDAGNSGYVLELRRALSVATIGASGAVFGVLLAFGMMYPNSQIMLLIPPVPIRAKYFVIGYGVVELMLGVTGAQSGVAHFAHVGGMLFGFFLLRYWKRKGKIYY